MNKQNQKEIAALEKLLKTLERKKRKTPGVGFAKIKIKEKLAALGAA